MEKQEMLEIGKKIVVDGFQKNLDHDAIKLEMAKAKIPFGRVNSIFMEIAVAEGLMLDPATVKKEIANQVAESDWQACKTWGDVESFVTGIVEEVEGAKRGAVLSAAKKFCKENEIKLPKQESAPKAIRAKGGKIANAIVNLFISNTEATREDFYRAVRPVVLGHKNTTDNINMHYLTAYAIANGLTIEKAAEKTKDFGVPTLVEGVKWASEQKLEIPDADKAAFTAEKAEQAK